MKYHILTLFPEMIEQGLHTSILGRAINNGYISLETTNIRDFSAVGSRKDREKAAHGLSDTAGKSTEPDDGGRAGA